MIGFMLGALGAAAWVVAADRLSAPAAEPRPRAAAVPDMQNSINRRRRFNRDGHHRVPPTALVEKPLIARLQESDVMRTLGGILAMRRRFRRDADGLADAAPGLSR